MDEKNDSSRTSPLDYPPELRALIESIRGNPLLGNFAPPVPPGAEALGVVLPQLISMLDSKDSTARREAVGALNKIGPASPSQVVPLLVRALQDPDRDVRHWAACALGTLGPAAEEALPALEAAFADDDFGVGQQAVWALGRMGPRALPALLRTLTGHAKEHRRNDAASALVELLGGIESVPEYVVPTLIDALRDTSWYVRGRVADILGQIGEGAAAAAPLMEALVRDDVENRIAAGRALWRIGRRPEVIPVLIAALDEAYEGCLVTAIETLGEIGPAAKEAVPTLQQLRRRVLRNDPEDWECYAQAFDRAMKAIEMPTA